MKYLLKCRSCEAMAWVPGYYEEDVNALELNLDYAKWEPASDCPHDNYDVIDHECPEPEVWPYG